MDKWHSFQFKWVVHCFCFMLVIIPTSMMLNAATGSDQIKNIAENDALLVEFGQSVVFLPF